MEEKLRAIEEKFKIQQQQQELLEGFRDIDRQEYDENEDLTNEEQELFLHQQLQQEYMNAMQDESDDGLMLGTNLQGSNIDIPDINQLMIDQKSLEMANTKLKNVGWIQWFLSLDDHEFFLEVDKDFIKDKFNLLEIHKQFPSKKLFNDCLKLVLSQKVPTPDDLQNQEFMELNQTASDLYGLIHARYIVSPTGLSKLYGKYLQGVFGNCPRALCDRQKVIPVGMSDKQKTSRLKVYCPRCEESYLPKYKQLNIDGAYFGTSLPQVFMKSIPNAIILPPKVYYYEPKIFGFRLFSKKGSNFYTPTQGGVKYTEEDENVDKLIQKFKENFKKQKVQQQQQQQQVKSEQQQSQSKKNKKKKH